MAVFTITVSDPNGVDTNLLFPGLSTIDVTGASWSGSAGSLHYQRIVNGVEQPMEYRINFTGILIDEAGLSTSDTSAAP